MVVTFADRLLDPPYTHARRSDPDTSKQAGDTARGYEGQVGRQALRMLVEIERRGGGGATCHEIAMRWAYIEAVPAENSISRRLTTLRRLGYVRDTGERRMGGRGANQCVHASTPEGRAWLRSEEK